MGKSLVSCFFETVYIYISDCELFNATSVKEHAVLVCRYRDLTFDDV